MLEIVTMFHHFCDIRASLSNVKSMLTLHYVIASMQLNLPDSATPSMSITSIAEHAQA